MLPATPPPPAEVIESKTELLPVPDRAASLAPPAPPAPTVTVNPELVTVKEVAVL
jgi:hypothetical protein